MCSQPPLVVPHQLLRGQPAHPLNEPALNLAKVDRPVQRLAGIVQNVCALHNIFASQCIDRHFRAGRSIGEIVERMAFALCAIPVDFRRLVEPCRRQLHPRHIGLLDEVGEGKFLIAHLHPVRLERDLVDRHRIFVSRKIDQPLLDLLRRVLRSHAVEVRAR